MSLRFYHCLILSCFVADLLMEKVTASPEVRQKRSDDGGPLEAVVEQLSQEVTSLKTEVAALKTKTDTLDKTVAFHVWNSAQPVRTTNYGTIILNHAVTNIDNAYNTLTGVFTAPVSGLFDFQGSILSYNPGAKPFIHVGIYVDSKEVSRAVCDSRHGYYIQSTMKAIVHVNAGQQVYLKNVEDQVHEYYDSLGEPYTTFSGFLIKAD